MNVVGSSIAHGGTGAMLHRSSLVGGVMDGVGYAISSVEDVANGVGYTIYGSPVY